VAIRREKSKEKRCQLKLIVSNSNRAEFGRSDAAELVLDRMEEKHRMIGW
jgi:hypothetical protein